MSRIAFPSEHTSEAVRCWEQYHSGDGEYLAGNGYYPLEDRLWGQS
jgi:hypothetical protein